MNEVYGVDTVYGIGTVYRIGMVYGIGTVGRADNPFLIVLLIKKK